MPMWEFERVAPVRNAVGMAAARDVPLDVEQVAQDLEESAARLTMLLEELDQRGLILLAPDNEPEFSALLTRAGSQYLAKKGQVPSEVLAFLPKVVDDLHAREALIHGGTVMVDEFRQQLLEEGRAVDHAAGVVPPAFASAVDEGVALDLFAAAIALIARLSSGRPAGCLAEEIMAVELIGNAEVWFDMESDKGALDAEEAKHGVDALRGIFELFEDDDVLDLFTMEEPADAALAGHSRINRQAGVVDQRFEAWFRPFGGVAATGHLDERPAPSES
jgi:hypothetical protein